MFSVDKQQGLLGRSWGRNGWRHSQGPLPEAGTPHWLMGRWGSRQDLENPSSTRDRRPSLPQRRDRRRSLHHHGDSGVQSSTVSEKTAS